VVALTTPPLIAATGLVAKALRGARLVYWVQDLYPEVAVAFGALRPRSPVTRLMRALSRAVMRRADRVVTLGDEMRERCIIAGAKAERAMVIPNWANGEAVRPVPHVANTLRSELVGSASTLVMYSGNMGRAHDVETILGAARLLCSRQDIRFVFVGDGVKRAAVEVASRELPNVRLGPYQPRERLAESLSAADLHLIALSPEIEGLIEPSKLYGIMAAGRPALFVGPARSEVALTITRSGCGDVVRNGDAARLAARIADLADDSEGRAQMGARARQVFMRCYTRQIATTRFRELLIEVAEASSSVAAVPQQAPANEIPDRTDRRQGA
jgi:glycosyltransferase involved in cell wall biosynthesis